MMMMTRGSLRQLSLRIKLAVFAGAVVVLVVLGQTFQELSQEAISVQDQVNLRARLTLMSLASAMAPDWRGGKVPDLAPYAARLRKELDVQGLALIEPDGTMVTWYGEQPTAEQIRRVTRLRLRTSLRAPWGLSAQAVPLLVTAPVMEGPSVRGYLLCAFTSSEPAERLADLARGAMLTALFWVGVGGILTLWVTGRLVRPLVRLAADLGEIGRGEVGRGYRVPAEGLADGEIGVVQQRLARLSETLEAERTHVDQLNAALRHQVDVVSADLERAAFESQTILDSVRDGILLVDVHGTVVAANDPARRLLGVDLAESQTPLWQRVATPEALAHAVAQAIALSEPMMLHCETLGASGQEPRRLRVRVASVRRSDGGSGSAVVVAEDVTATQRQEEQMWRSERLAALGTLTAGLAHQIGNYLHAIKGYADLLARRLDASSELRADVGVIQKEVRDAAALMEKMLLLARTRPPSRVPTRIGMLAREALDLVRVQARHGNVVLREELPEDGGCVVEADPHLLTQALLNILINAIQAMPNGGDLRVALDEGEGGACVVCIDDTGSGMPPEVLRHIFDPFFTTKAEGQGTGLGLTIAHRIVEMHDGLLRVESTSGVGTRFEIELPVGESDG